MFSMMHYAEYQSGQCTQERFVTLQIYCLGNQSSALNSQNHNGNLNVPDMYFAEYESVGVKKAILYPFSGPKH